MRLHIFLNERSPYLHGAIIRIIDKSFFEEIFSKEKYLKSESDKLVVLTPLTVCIYGWQIYGFYK